MHLLCFLNQWRKDLQKQLEEEEKERQKALKEQQNEAEVYQKKMAELRAQKFSKSKNRDNEQTEKS